MGRRRPTPKLDVDMDALVELPVSTVVVSDRVNVLSELEVEDGIVDKYQGTGVLAATAASLFYSDMSALGSWAHGQIKQRTSFQQGIQAPCHNHTAQWIT